MTFGQQYSSWWPIPFPYGDSDVPIVAPFWADFNQGDTFYHIYDRSDSSSESAALNNAIFSSLQERLSSSDDAALGRDLEFQAQWMAVITWNNVVPFYRRNNSAEVR